MRILITGASGQLGGYLARELRALGEDTVAWSGSRSGELFGVRLVPVDLRDLDRLTSCYREVNPSWVIHAAAVSRVDTCYEDYALARQVNVDGTARLAELAAENGARLTFVSTDLVFDGQVGNYGEDDQATPLSRYGQSKLAAEEVTARFPQHVIARVSLLYGPALNSQPTLFFAQQLRALREGTPMKLFEDEWRTPLSLQHAARGLIELAKSDCSGHLHMGGPERMSRFEMGQRLAAVIGADPSMLEPVRQASVATPEPRPRDVSLNSQRWCELFPNSQPATFETALNDMGL